VSIKYLEDRAALDFEHAGLRVLIVGDDEPFSGPQDNDNAGTIYSWTRDFDGDERINEPDLEIDVATGEHDEPDWQVVDLPRYMAHYHDAALTIGLRFADYGSSGARLYVDNDDPNCCICFTQKELDHEWSGSVDDATKYALARVNELDEWLQGNVYGVVVCSPDDDSEPEVLDSVWGFIGDPFGKSGEYMKAEGRALAESVRAELDHEAAEAHRWACADVMTV
jgi:hypothetical protein